MARAAIGSGALVGIRLFDADGADDSVLLYPNGNLCPWTGDGGGGLVASRQVGSGAHAYDWIAAFGQVDGRGRSDLIARSARTGDLWLLPGTRNGFGDRRLIGGGFDAYDLLG